MIFSFTLKSHIICSIAYNRVRFWSWTLNNEVIFKLASSSRLGPEYTRPGSSITDRTSCLFSIQVMISKNNQNGLKERMNTNGTFLIDFSRLSQLGPLAYFLKSHFRYDH